MLRLIRRYGPIMTMPILGLGDVAIVSDPALAKEVFTAPTDVLLGGEGVGPAAVIYGSGSMFVQEEPDHLRRRETADAAAARGRAERLRADHRGQHAGGDGRLAG